MTSSIPPRGRGSRLNPDSRFSGWKRNEFEDDWPGDSQDEPAGPPTTLIVDRARSIISHNRSPDVPFDQSINPYKGCEHGCVYCFARPSHAYLGLSPGLDFETRIVWKPDAAQLLRQELGAPSYRCRPIALGVNTDAWQPVERKLGISRQLLAVLAETRHPVSIITKSALIERDLDLLTDLARDGLVRVMFSITTLDPQLARIMEPRAAAPQRRLIAMQRLRDAGIPVGVLCAPLIPAINDHELESVLAAARAAGADSAGYVLLRLPLELKTLFEDWLTTHFPDRAGRVLNLLRDLRGGDLYDTRFGHRMRGQGPLAELYAQRLRLARSKLGFSEDRQDLPTHLFQPPRPASPQASLF